MVFIIDVGIGNINSVCSWLTRGNVAYRLISHPVDLKTGDVILLPGVGSAGAMMSKLKLSNLDNFIIIAKQSGFRIIGICLGAQILFENSDEDGGIECLGLLKGSVKKLDGNKSNTGWDDVFFSISDLSLDWKSQMLNRNRRSQLAGRAFFNHSYGIDCIDQDCTLVKKENKSGLFCAIVHKGNIFAFQFHPEKSQHFGDLILKLFL
jgi:glutamine amidotransferase